ncbi:MAG: DMT family transporter [Dongiaceae bacterium]
MDGHGHIGKMTMLPSGALLALASALLFGASVPATKLLVAEINPWLLAGLLYLGSGTGLWVIRSTCRLSAKRMRDMPISAQEWRWLGAAILAGGVIGPVLMMAGLRTTSGSTAALLLNLESVFTALIAWIVFRENFDRRIVLGVIAILLGALTLSWRGGVGLAGWSGPLLIGGACLAWALDNNLTRRVSLGDAGRIAMLKGLVAGVTNIGLAAGLGVSWPAVGTLLVAGAVGFVGYGLSLVLFVLALRQLGAARAGAYYATAPFFGAAVAIVALGDNPSVQFLAAGLLMGTGVWLHLTERHEHEHAHADETHRHSHSHDSHHDHSHGPADPAGEPHTHVHAHAPRRHKHPHYPDAHHRHGHD